MCGSFGPVVEDPSFLAAEAEAVASLVDRGEVNAAEEGVFGAVMRWVKEDEVARVGALDRLLPLVRFPMLETPQEVIAEPLFMQHPVGTQLLVECHPGFAATAAAADCRRLRPREGLSLSQTVSYSTKKHREGGGRCVCVCVCVCTPIDVHR